MRYQTLRLTKFYKSPADEQKKPSDSVPLASSGSSMMSSATNRSLSSTESGGKTLSWSSLGLSRQSSSTAKGRHD
ncbi:hypothetical protein LTR70_007895 [Exophiala xenobiotica]|uniref:Uncharacterized protein n=1 Tax=Lithohypha guttulata TaxID=1690604 RepID=A0ABR0K8K7_9EURO|nr:hypothetical protein LTR24_005571 [Lithohypha guttulata]KAK5312900.1 hypothetical protein LTR70_007895 [Exophiala xenobiotica]